MLVCMRTTLNLPDGLVHEAKAHALRTGQTLTAVLEEALRLLLASRDDAPSTVEPLPAYGDPDGHFLVDLADTDAVWSALDADPAP